MNKLSTKRLVAAAVIERDGRILIGKRKRNSYLGGKWEFPGGKAKEHETPEACLRRELLEELGIEARIGELICMNHDVRDSRFPVYLAVYRAVHLSGEIQLNDHEEIRWVLPEELSAYDFLEADIPVIEKILEGLRL